MGRRGLRGRFSFWIGRVAVSPSRTWRRRWYIGPGHPAELHRGFVIIVPYVRIQFGGCRPWASSRSAT